MPSLVRTRRGIQAARAASVEECPSCGGVTGTKDCPLCFGDGHVDGRTRWLVEARRLTSEAAADAYGWHEPAARAALLRLPLADLEDDEDWSMATSVKDLLAHARRTPYGFARYGGRLLRACLLDLPAAIDACQDDREAM